MLFGLDIGGTKIELSAFDDTTCVFTRRIPTPTESYTAFKDNIKEIIMDADREAGCRGSVGVGVPGFIESSSGKASCCNIPCANGQVLQRDLELVLERPVKVENDANCFTLSEVTGGAANGFKSVFGVILGTGCGGGLYLDGKLYTGRNNRAGEWGHTPLPYSVFKLAGNDFPIITCGCGLKGCLDNYLSGRGLELIYTYKAGDVKKGVDIIQAYRECDYHAVGAVEIYCELLASGLGGMVNTIDPEVIILGGGVSNFDELYELLPPLLSRYTLKTGQLPKIKKAVFGDSGGTRGAAMLNA